MSIVNEEDIKSMWVKRYGHEEVFYMEKYKFRNANLDTTLEDKELANSVEIGGITFKIEE